MEANVKIDAMMKTCQYSMYTPSHSLPSSKSCLHSLLGPSNTSVFPYYYFHCSPLLLLLCPCCPHIVIIVPHRSPLLLLLCPYIIIVMSSLIILQPLRLLYIERRSCHLYHPRIVHLCNVKEVPPPRESYFEVVDLSFLLFGELVA